ncbi:hypothetical protein MHBO_002524 [Bonamia ostreae]|uniref:LAGLIDADG homing endonuclease n=1 Tax=Bonamia ostreae TaxID=126728 RepID=A0ABV2AMK7_9EUKA
MLFLSLNICSIMSKLSNNCDLKIFDPKMVVKLFDKNFDLIECSGNFVISVDDIEYMFYGSKCNGTVYDLINFSNVTCVRFLILTKNLNSTKNLLSEKGYLRDKKFAEKYPTSKPTHFFKIPEQHYHESVLQL